MYLPDLQTSQHLLKSTLENGYGTYVDFAAVYRANIGPKCKTYGIKKQYDLKT